MKLYVGKLPYSFTEKELKELFESYGAVKSAVIIMDRDTGKSKGFGFVEFGTKEEGENAIKELNGKVIGKGPIVVNEARPQEKRESNGNRPFRSRFGG